MRYRPAATWVLAASLPLTAILGPAAETPIPSDPQEDIGRRIYREGRLADGSPLRAIRPEGFVLEGEQAACVTCHRESGMGSVEGSLELSLLVPPVAGPLLFAPARFAGTFLNEGHHWVPNKAWARALTRGAYDDGSLARALREGLDPDGQPLIAPMPRYALDESSLSALAAYLRGLGAAPAPGVETDGLHLATVVTPDAPIRAGRGGDRGAAGLGGRFPGLRQTLGPASLGAVGPVRDLVRAVGGPLSGAAGLRHPVRGRWCRMAAGTPLLRGAPGPLYPAIPGGRPRGRSGLLFALLLPRGHPGGAAARRPLACRVPGARGQAATHRSDVQRRRRAAGRRGLDRALGTEAQPESPRRFRPTAPAAGLDALGEATALALWLRPEEIALLVAAMPEGPGSGPLYLSSLLAPPESLALPPAWKARVTFVSLFDDLGLQGEIARLRLAHWLDRQELETGGDLRPRADAYAAAYLLTRALGEIRGQEARRPGVPLSREHLLEALEQEVNKYADGTPLVDPDSHVAFYGRMSLGPRQRMAARGGALLRFMSPESHRLVAVTGRIVP